MNRTEVQDWLDRYVEAWRAGDPDRVGDLFGADAVYNYRPYPGGRVLVGRPAIVEGWLAHTDGPDDWEASYEVFAVDRDRAVAVGSTRYFGVDDSPDEVFHNCFLLRFDDDGRCAEFIEYWMLQPQDEA